MAGEISQALGWSGAGDLYMQPWLPNGTKGLMKDTGNATKCAIKSNSSRQDQISRKRASSGQVLESVSRGQPATISITIETVNRDSIRYCFMGEESDYSQLAVTEAAKAYTLDLGGWTPLGAENIDMTQPFVVTNDAGTTTYVIDVDYKVLPRLGWLYAIPGGAMATPKPAVKVTFKALPFTGARVRGSVQASIKAYLLVDAINEVDNSPGILRVWEAILTPTGEFDILADNWNRIELGGTLKKPADKAEPFVFDQLPIGI